MARRGSSCADGWQRRWAAECGATLAELLVVLAIMSVLAVMALPVAETAVMRRKETELRQTLRDVRGAIDRLHEDIVAGTVQPGDGTVSEDGYPVDLMVLVEGAAETESGKVRRYLRRMPVNPFARDGASVEEQWLFIGYRDAADAGNSGGADIYDLRPRTDRVALDGTDIADW